MIVSIDRLLLGIENLKWLPWIGNQYNSISKNKRILIIGESHYHNGTEQSINNHKSANFTRKIVQEMAVERWYYGTKIFPNFHRALFGNDYFDSSTFWNLVSFYNFVQRPMSTNIERPIPSDFYNGWNPFFEVIKILQPEVCIFIGVGASNSLKKAANASEVHLKSMERDCQVGRTYPRRAIITANGDADIKLLFLQHTSKYFSWSAWNFYLEKTIQEELDWFKKMV